MERELIGEWVRRPRRLRLEPTGDRPVVGGAPFESSHGQFAACPIRKTAAKAAHLLKHRAVLGRVDDHRDPLVVLRGRAGEGDPTDVDVLLAVVRIGVGRRVLLEGVELDGDQVETEEAAFLELGLSLGRGGGQYAREQSRMQCLDATAEPGADAGQVLGRPRVGACRRERRARPSRGPDFNVQRFQVLSKPDEAALIVER